MFALLLSALLFAHEGEASTAPRWRGVEVHPRRIELNDRFGYTQLLIDVLDEEGVRRDVTREVSLQASTPHLAIDERGLVRPLADGEGELVFTLSDLEVKVPYVVRGQDEAPRQHFLSDVMPILSRAGCNTGSCHGSADGQKGFKLSLRGYDPAFDHAALTDDMAARRFDRVRPEESLFLLKPTAAVPHEGGLRLEPESADYARLFAWIEDGARFTADAPRVASLEVLPKAPILQRAGETRQFAVLATYTDGSVRDVSAHAFLETSNIEVTSLDERGLVTALRRGEAAILARYEGRYAAARVLVMGDRTGWSWEAPPPPNNTIDELVYAKLERIRSRPSELCTDAEFLRRVSLDLTGVPPTPRQTRMFLMDRREVRAKRDELIDRLIGSPDFIDYWTNKWSDLLQVNPKFLGREGAERFRRWIEAAVASNEPYDEFARRILSASGSTYENPPASYYKVLREPDLAMENTTQLFLGIRFNCNKCHDHPFERWTQRDHWQLASYFARVGRKNAEGSPMLVDGAAQEEIVYELDEGEVRYPSSSEVAVPRFPYEHDGALPEQGPRREELAAWITAAENPYFATSFVNRIWSYFLGVGLIEPVDDLRAGNPPSNPELLQHLSDEFVAGGFDVRRLMRTICRSRTYQHSVSTNEWNATDEINFSHALARRLPSEVLYDAVHQATGVRPRLGDERPGTRAVQLVDAGVKTPDGFLQLFGRPPRESACECERESGMSLGQALNLVNGPTIGDAISAEESALTELVRYEEDPERIVEELFLSFLCRFPTEKELAELAPTLVPTDPANRTALDPEGAAELARRRSEWEEELLPLAVWRPLRPLSVSSEGGAGMVVNDDLSVFVEPGAEKDAYTLVLTTDGAPITGLQLETLPDERLPMGGPGRNDSGNYVLSELTVQALPARAQEPARTLVRRNPSTDYSQPGYPVENSIDGQENTGWAVHQRYGVPHAAVYELAPDADGGGPLAGPQVLVVRMTQNYGSNHVIGRFRFSVTTSPYPVRHHGLSDERVAALNRPPALRTAEQEALLHAHFVETHADLAERIRLAATQDLAWALANSPAFLFNR